MIGLALFTARLYLLSIYMRSSIANLLGAFDETPNVLVLPLLYRYKNIIIDT